MFGSGAGLCGTLSPTGCWRNWPEPFFLTFACVSIAAVLTITVYIFSAGIPAMAEIGVFKFLFGTTWDASTNQFGILPLILASICGTVGAIIIGVPIGILTAVFFDEIARPRVAKIIHPQLNCWQVSLIGCIRFLWHTCDCSRNQSHVPGSNHW